MYIYIIIIIIILLIFLFNFFNKLYINKELFSVVNTKENNNPYNEDIYNINNLEYSISTNSDILSKETFCDVGQICGNMNGFGIYDNSCNCISSNTDHPPIVSNAEVVNTPSPHSTTATTATTTPAADTSCIANQDFSKYCSSSNPNSGVKSIIPCNSTTSRVECGLYYINGIHYNNNNIITPCLNKSSDFDTWCKYYNNKPIPNGYNVNSIGAADILIGAHGDCYNNDGTPNKNLARAICDNNHIDTIAKLEPDNKKINYNFFTECKPINNTDFTFLCSELLNYPYDKTYADQILGYDCNPGFARAKCIKKSDIIQNNFNTELNTNVLSSNKPNIENNANCC